MKRNGSQTILQGAIILTASTLIVKVIGAMFKIPLANILGGVGMSYFVSAYDVLIPIYSMTVTGLGVSVSRVISESTGRGELSENILKTARTLFLVIGLSELRCCFWCALFNKTDWQSVGRACGLLHCTISAVFMHVLRLSRLFSGDA